MSYSRPIASTSTHRNDGGNVPTTRAEGGGGNSKSDDTPKPEPMTRRQYVIALSEAEVVDRVLGEQVAKRLYELCVEAEKHGW